jgi:hypothetical protein
MALRLHLTPCRAAPPAPATQATTGSQPTPPVEGTTPPPRASHCPSAEDASTATIGSACGRSAGTRTSCAPTVCAAGGGHGIPVLRLPPQRAGRLKAMVLWPRRDPPVIALPQPSPPLSPRSRRGEPRLSFDLHICLSVRQLLCLVQTSLSPPFSLVVRMNDAFGARHSPPRRLLSPVAIPCTLPLSPLPPPSLSTELSPRSPPASILGNLDPPPCVCVWVWV